MSETEFSECPCSLLRCRIISAPLSPLGSCQMTSNCKGRQEKEKASLHSFTCRWPPALSHTSHPSSSFQLRSPVESLYLRFYSPGHKKTTHSCTAFTVGPVNHFHITQQLDPALQSTLIIYVKYLTWVMSQTPQTRVSFSHCRCWFQTLEPVGFFSHFHVLFVICAPGRKATCNFPLEPLLQTSS